MIVKRFLCLANSKKLSGRCVAGRELKPDGPGAWIRPVSSRIFQEISEYERQYPDGSDPQVLDIIDIPFIEHQPRDYQSENWLIDSKRYWLKVRTAVITDLDRFLEPSGPLWINGHSTYAGSHDRVPLEVAKDLKTSLRFIRAVSVTLLVFLATFGNKRRVQARFHHNGTSYGLWVTDPRVEREYLSRDDGTYELGPCFLTISLGEAFQGYCYKLVAAIIPYRPRR
jgi:hypothetical protein